MNPKRLLGGVAVGATATALANRLLRGAPEAFEPPLGRPLSTYQWRGLDVAYTEAGDPADPDLVLLHGLNAAGSSHEFSRVVDGLAEAYHVIAPEYPGFGHSDRPPFLYSGTLYTTFLGEFLADLTDEPAVLASSLSAAYVAAATDRENLAVRRFVLVCPTASTVPGTRTWVRSLLRARLVGEGLYNLLASKPSIRYFLGDHAFSGPAAVPEEWVNYDWQTAHQPGARFAPASFVGGFLDLDIDLGRRLADRAAPVTIAWGREATLPPLERGRELAAAADARLVVFENADLLPHAEHPDAFLEALFE